MSVSSALNGGTSPSPSQSFVRSSIGSHSGGSPGDNGNLAIRIDKLSESMLEAHANKYRGENLRGSNVGVSISSAKSLGDDALVIDSAAIISSKIKREVEGATYGVYVINVTMKAGLTWVVEKRYHEFRDLWRELRRVFPHLEDIPFPKKRWFFNLSESILNERQIGLNEFLRAVIGLDPQPRELVLFLNVVDNVPGTFPDPRISEKLRASSMSSIYSALSVHDFKLIKVLGKGSFGKVLLVKPSQSLGTDYLAMKVLKKSEVVRRHQVDHTRTERQIMEMINHKYIMRLRYAFQAKDKLYMITDYCSGGELFFHLKRMRRFTEGMMRYYSAQIALAIQHLHEHNIMYRDLKPENVLLDKFGNCKLTDFGLSKIITPTMDGSKNTFCGTPEYLAPEILIHKHRGTGYSVEIDWWALGIVCFEFLTGWPPFFDREFSKMCEKIMTRSLKFPTKYSISSHAQNVIKAFLQRDPRDRLCCNGSVGSIEGLQCMPFYQDFDWEQLEAGKLPPPFVPSIGKDPLDTRNFDKEFTKLSVKESPPDTKKVYVSDSEFRGFSFSDPITFAVTCSNDDPSGNGR